MLRIVGAATADEVAALIAVMTRLGGEPQSEPEPVVGSQWAAPARLLRGRVEPSGWWEAGLPK